MTNPAPTSFGDDDYVTGKDVRALLAQVAAASVTPALQGANEIAASAVLATARQIYAKDFQRYGHEIAAKLGSVPKNLWTLDNVETVVKLVRSDHLDEIARERANELVSTMEPTIRSTGVGGSVSVPADKAHSLASDKIPVEWKERAARAGITEQIVYDFCRANEITVDAFYKQFDTPRNAIVQEISLGQAASAG